MNLITLPPNLKVNLITPLPTPSLIVSENSYRQITNDHTDDISNYNIGPMMFVVDYTCEADIETHTHNSDLYDRTKYHNAVLTRDSRMQIDLNA